MKREYGLDQIEKDDASLVTVGTFDGVHVGHQAILRYVVSRARQHQGRSVIVTFDPHPREVLTGVEVGLLSTIDERARILEALGVDRFIVLPFNKEFAALPPERFVCEILVERIGLQEIVVGYDHGFGRGRRGGTELLRTLGEKHGFAVDVIPPQEVDEQVVSSTIIRQLLVEEGHVRRAAEMLGRRYTIAGTVVHGDRRGHTIGYPTANIAIEHPRKVIPKNGVYAVHVRLAGEEGHYSGMMNIGIRPTFDGSSRVHLEVHLFDFDRDLYEHQLRVEFVERLRDERKFDSIAALIEQLSQDERQSKRVLMLR